MEVKLRVKKKVRSSSRMNRIFGWKEHIFPCEDNDGIKMNERGLEFGERAREMLRVFAGSIAEYSRSSPVVFPVVVHISNSAKSSARLGIAFLAILECDKKVCVRG